MGTRDRRWKKNGETRRDMTKRQKDEKTKRQKDKEIVMSGQFRTLAMFLVKNECDAPYNSGI